MVHVRTNEFKEFHATQRVASAAASGGPKAPRAKIARRANPLGDSLATVEAQFRRSRDEALVSISSALRVIDHIASTDMMREAVAGSLCATDGALQAVGVSVRQLQRVVEETLQGLSRKQAAATHTEFLEHTFNALSVLGERAGSLRIAVALAREEVDRHRTHLLRVKKCGVFAWTAGDDDATGRACVPASAASSRAKPQASPTNVASTVVSQFANRTTAALTRTFATARPSGSRAVAAVEVSQYTSTAAAVDSRVAQLDEARIGDLQIEGQQLLEAQRLSSVAAAKEVEVAVRDLSILTTILNEEVALQAEKLELVERDMSKSHDNLAGASSELRQATRDFWSAKRVLAAVLFLCSLVLLFANKIIR